ncbi:MAG: hypothetical protein KC776_43290 [Myxococcales bacterium]|nr:hypothetical protein [Myxococcales bacterium]MCB9582321.1 hypothetical protein [Polyangiaceae bacterium]
MGYRDPSPPKWQLPDASNLYGSIETSASREAIAQAFANAGWEVHKCGFEEHRLEAPFAELVLDSERPFLIHGLVAEVTINVRLVADVLRGTGAHFSLECYSESGELLATVTS